MGSEHLLACLSHRLAKPLWVLVLALLPFWLLLQALSGGLGANPAEALTRQSGEWALRLLLLVLLLRPLRVWTGWAVWLRFRRVSGVAMYLYALLHLSCWAWFEQGFEVQDMVADVVKRPFILVGVITVVLLSPLALTSNNGSIRRLGIRRWQLLHRLVYVCAPLALLHFWWMREGKNNFTDVWIYLAVLAALMIWRIKAGLSR